MNKRAAHAGSAVTALSMAALRRETFGELLQLLHVLRSENGQVSGKLSTLSLINDRGNKANAAGNGDGSSFRVGGVSRGSDPIRTGPDSVMAGNTTHYNRNSRPKLDSPAYRVYERDAVAGRSRATVAVPLMRHAPAYVRRRGPAAPATSAVYGGRASGVNSLWSDTTFPSISMRRPSLHRGESRASRVFWDMI
ncbi:hypothetical protein EVAR_29807_1 [Eumeta japonica]|uniref:Uncharacterized protein n=1 Tax=Eumeta variegata TaxID=151549 RepID=A0A4C1XQ15_EUMVA|nr:hypothetical protein EVAR_29807_1 [Eumeta japonica]